MKHFAGLSVITLLLGAIGAAAVQESAPNSFRRTIPVTVLDGQGKPVGGLTPQSFQGEFRGQPVRVLSVKWDSRPRRIVVLLDASSSMSWAEKWTLGRKGVEDILLHARPQDQIAVIVFSDHVVNRVEFGPPGPASLARLGSLPTDPKELNKKPARTALLDALPEALQLLSRRNFGDVIYVITDGGDNASKLTMDKVKETLACADVRTFFLLLFDPDLGRGVEYLGARYVGEDLAEVTGGNAANPHFADTEAVGATARSLYGQMLEFYAVEIELPRSIDKRRRWKLKAVDEQGKKMSGVKIIYPQLLVPCSDAAPSSR